MAKLQFDRPSRVPESPGWARSRVLHLKMVSVIQEPFSPPEGKRLAVQFLQQMMSRIGLAGLPRWAASWPWVDLRARLLRLQVGLRASRPNCGDSSDRGPVAARESWAKYVAVRLDRHFQVLVADSHDVCGGRP